MQVVFPKFLEGTITLGRRKREIKWRGKGRGE
jgi:hypothetical protein